MAWSAIRYLRDGLQEPPRDGVDQEKCPFPPGAPVPWRRSLPELCPPNRSKWQSRVTLWSHEDRFVSDVPNVTVSPRRVAMSASMAVGNRSSRMRGRRTAQAGTQERKGRRVPVYGPPPVIPRSLRPPRVPRHLGLLRPVRGR